jgi:hypothetical protein
MSCYNVISPLCLLMGHVVEEVRPRRNFIVATFSVHADGVATEDEVTNLLENYTKEHYRCL